LLLARGLGTPARCLLELYPGARRYAATVVVPDLIKKA
jgi:hypothetical protein